ncbi:uncharacterized protein G2W53_007137 [Senna tora]|uniref:Uncharacterized protein n=1 Tax=Senna tora TaxID=362788 RepID=A0A834X660_9FABA|nr:uncharacterized protein G2W53_007137 [Senna tora]
MAYTEALHVKAAFLKKLIG